MEFHLYEWISLPPHPFPPLPAAASPAPLFPAFPFLPPTCLCGRPWCHHSSVLCEAGQEEEEEEEGVIWASSRGGMRFGVVPGRGKVGPGCRVSPGREGGSRRHARPESREETGTQLVTINFGSRESDGGENFARLSAKAAWVYFCRVGETPSPLCIGICLCYIVEIKSVIYL